MDVSEHVDDVMSRLPEEADATEEQVSEKLDQLINQYRVPEDEAVSSTVSHFTPDGASASNPDGGNTEANIGELSEGEQWINLEAKVETLWDTNSDAVHQVGLLKDATGMTKFIAFDDSLPKVSEGETYRIESAVTEEDEQSDYDDDVNIKFIGDTTTIESIDGIDETKTFVEPVVDLKERRTGLFKTCGECGRALYDGKCSQHGTPDEEDRDLGIRAVVDDGVDTPKTIIFGRELTEDLTGITLDEAIDMFKDSLGDPVVTEAISDIVVGHYFKIEAEGRGANTWRAVSVEEFDAPGVTEEQARDTAELITEVAA